MPCRSDYMEANGYEIGMSQVYCLLEELRGKKLDPNSGNWRGYHPKAYNKTHNRAEHDKATKQLCSKLQKLDVTKYSLEMQIWWRDHQEADKKRLQEELKEVKKEEDKEKALAKLTPYEQKLLGL